MKTSDHIISLLESMGFKFYKYSLDSNKEFPPMKFQKRLDIENEFKDLPLCQCNDALFINVEINDFILNEHSIQSVTFEIVSENNNHDWVDFKFYNLGFNKFNSQNDILYYCRKLVKVWEAAQD